MTDAQAKSVSVGAVIRPVLVNRIARVLEQFNYVKMSELMGLVKWRWQRYPGPGASTPTPEEIRRCAGELFEGATQWWVDHPWEHAFCSSGGLSATIDEHGAPALVFEIMGAEMMLSKGFGDGGSMVLTTGVGGDGED
jgi:hypothetical protein